MTKFRLDDRSRKFAKDVGGIVLGVLIALAIGEVADGVRKRMNARVAFEAVRADMIDNSALFAAMPLQFLPATAARSAIW